MNELFHKKRIYLDYAATTPLDVRVLQAMEPYWTEIYGNPASIHIFGQEALNAIEESRAMVASVIGAARDEVIFTGSGSESDNTAVKSTCFALRERGNHIITSSIEHSAVLNACSFMESQGFDVTYLPVDGDGIVDPDSIRRAITNKTILVSIQHGNNEIGTIQPLKDIGEITREFSVTFHTDAVQTFGHNKIDVNEMKLDLVSFSAHKIYGPKGIGGLYVRKDTPFIPLIHGGRQEAGLRGSTHNVPGIVGMGKAAELALLEMQEDEERICKLRDRLLTKIRSSIEGVNLNGSLKSRLANNINLSFNQVEGDSLVMNLDLEGVACSSRSACASKSTEPSHILTAIGLSPVRAGETLRMTLGRFTSEQEIDTVYNILERSVSHLRSLAAFGEQLNSNH